MKAILFPGQGAQKVGMGRDLYERSAAARSIFDQADRILDRPLSRLCFEGAQEELTRTEHAQPGIYVTSVAAVSALEEAGRLDRATFGAAAGLSLGEYTACWFAGVFSFEDGLRLVQRRGAAMQQACDVVPSGMVSLIGVDRDKAEQVCDSVRGEGVLVVANLNAPGQVVLSGSQDACSRVRTAARAMGVRRARSLDVAGAFHSPLMEPVRRALEDALSHCTLSDATIPVVSNVTAEPVTDAGEIRSLLARQVVSPVLWEASVRRLVQDGMTEALEPPPGHVLEGLMRKTAPEVTVRAPELP